MLYITLFDSTFWKAFVFKPLVSTRMTCTRRSTPHLNSPRAPQDTRTWGDTWTRCAEITWHTFSNLWSPMANSSFERISRWHGMRCSPGFLRTSRSTFVALPIGKPWTQSSRNFRLLLCTSKVSWSFWQVFFHFLLCSGGAYYSTTTWQHAYPQNTLFTQK